MREVDAMCRQGGLMGAAVNTHANALNAKQTILQREAIENALRDCGEQAKEHVPCLREMLELLDQTHKRLITEVDRLRDRLAPVLAYETEPAGNAVAPEPGRESFPLAAWVAVFYQAQLHLLAELEDITHRVRV